MNFKETREVVEPMIVSFGCISLGISVIWIQIGFIFIFCLLISLSLENGLVRFWHFVKSVSKFPGLQSIGKSGEGEIRPPGEVLAGPTRVTWHSGAKTWTSSGVRDYILYSGVVHTIKMQSWKQSISGWSRKAGITRKPSKDVCVSACVF